MPRVNRTRLIALSHREFNREAQAPALAPTGPSKFRGVRLSLNRYDVTWDKKRGAAARLMAVVLRESDQELTQRVCASAQSASTYRGAAEWLASEAQHLRKHVRHLDSAAGRLAVVLERCGQSTGSDQKDA
jgi:hypothetical protein